MTDTNARKKIVMKGATLTYNDFEEVLCWINNNRRIWNQGVYITVFHFKLNDYNV